MRRWRWLLAALAALWAGTPTTAALATPPNPEHKVTICHARPPDTAARGYVEITVDVASVGYQNSGHEGEHDADVIPPYEYTDGDGNTFTYPGKGDQAILEAGCAAPSPSPSPTVSPSVSPSPEPTETPEPPVNAPPKPDDPKLPPPLPNTGPVARVLGLGAAALALVAISGVVLWLTRKPKVEP